MFTQNCIPGFLPGKSLRSLNNTIFIHFLHCSIVTTNGILYNNWMDLNKLHTCISVRVIFAGLILSFE